MAEDVKKCFLLSRLKGEVKSPRIIVSNNRYFLLSSEQEISKLRACREEQAEGTYHGHKYKMLCL